MGVWVWLAAKKAPLLVVEFGDQDGEHDLGIAEVSPGTFDTACGKGYWKCQDTETPTLTLTTAGLDVFTCESANQFVYWDPKAKAFLKMWMSD